jgi:hypothetical protein
LRFHRCFLPLGSLAIAGFPVGVNTPASKWITHSSAVVGTSWQLVLLAAETACR